MKTVIDAVNEFKGDVRNANIGGIQTIGFYVTSSDSAYIYHSGGSPVCDVIEFNQCVDEMSKAEWIKPVTVPTFTQAMKDAKELPPVGSWFIDVELGDNGTEVEAIAHDIPLKRVVYKSAAAIEDCEYFGATIDECKVITPPIELEEKALYLFDTENKTKIVGQAYWTEWSSGGDWMINALRTNTNYHADRCTNIQLLEVTK